MRLARIAALLALFSSCLEPTEIVLELSTDLACDETNGVAISIGPQGQDDAGITTTTSTCSPDGSIGSLVVTPSGAASGVGIRVVLGVDASAESCATSGAYAGCIVARRSLEYDPHTPLYLPVELQASCLGVACDPNSTCFNGGCVDAGIPVCNGGVCTLPDAGPSDAGACSNVGPIALQGASTKFSSTPHIARMNGGYAVMWQGSPNQLEIMTIDEAGKVVSTFSMKPSVSKTNAVGSDGTSVLGLFESSNDAGTSLNDFAPMSDGGPVALMSTVGPVEGVFYESAGARWVTIGVYRNTTAQLIALPAANPIVPMQQSTPISDVALTSTGNDGYLASMYLQGAGCSVYQCSSTAGTCSTFGSLGTQFCAGVRTAVGPSANYAAVLTPNNAVYVTKLPLSGLAAQVPVDDKEAFVVLGTSANVTLVTRSANALLATNVLPPVATTTIDPVTGYPTSLLGGFDAVADGPNLTSYAVVYWGAANGTAGKTTAGLYYARLCK